MLKPKKKTNVLLVILLVLILCAVVAALLLVVLTFLLNRFKFSFQALKQVFFGKIYWKLVLALAILGIGFILWKTIPKLGKKLKDFNDGEDAKIIYPDNLKKNKLFITTTYDALNNFNDSSLLRAEKVGKKIKVLLSKEPSHAIVIGETGAGKSTAYIDPIIQCLGQTKTLPTMIITDPKGELFNKHSAMLKERGYTVSVFNLADPYKSTKWNPFENVITMIEALIEIDKEIKANPETANAYRYQRAQLEDDIYENCTDLVYTMCPVLSKTDPSWEQNARDLILGFVLAMTEDAREGKIRPEQINFLNLHFNLTKYCVGNPDILKTLDSYFANRPDSSKAKVLANGVMSTKNSEKTFASYLSAVNNYLSWLHDRGIQALTAKSELNFSNYDDAPNVLFLKIPDERKTRHRLVSILITQCYKALVEKARKNGEYQDSDKLKRNVYMLLDEFGNMPKFEDINNMISVARSRGIFFTFIIQSLEQLSNIYGNDSAKIIKDNCPMKVFLGTSSIATMEEFIKLGGNTKATSVSQSKDSTTTSIHSTSLITVTDLKTLNTKKDFGNALISTFGNPMMLSKYTPSFRVKVYQFGACSYQDDSFVSLDSLLFDICDKIIEVATVTPKVSTSKTRQSDSFNSLEILEERLRDILEQHEWEHYCSCTYAEKIEFLKMKKMAVAGSRSLERLIQKLIMELKYERNKTN